MPVDIQKLTQPFPQQAIRQREGGGGRRFDYVETHTVIHRLNDATDNNWNFEVVSLEWRNDMLIALGRLEIPGHGSRMGIGVQKVAAGGGEDLVKGAASDALKKAATLFGVALELYGPDYESGELPVERTRNAPQARQRTENRRYGHVAPAQTQPAAQPPPARQGVSPEHADEPATAPQIKAIFGIGRGRGMEPDAVKAWVSEQFGGKHVDDLTRLEASQIIDHLQAEPAGV